MKWLTLVLASAVIWGFGVTIFAINAMSECLPPFAPGFDECITDKRRDALIIILASLAAWMASVFLIFRKRPTS